MSFEMYSVDKISVDDKRSLIDRVAKDVFCESFGEMLYNIRYSKKEEYGLERIWNQTQHIITTCPYYKTEDGNFNMIFNDDENLKEFITYFYNIMPIVQTYVCKLVLKILKQLELINEIEFIINNSIITNRYLMFSQKIENKELDDILNDTLLICPRCFKEIDNYKENQEILSLWYLYCPYCKKKINLDRFIFYNLHKENGEYFRGRYKRRSKK